MRRFFLAAAVALTAGVSPALAGYLIVRVIFEGTPAAPVGPDGQPLPPTPGSPPAGVRPGGEGTPGTPGAPGAEVPPKPDASRSLVVVMPVIDQFQQTFYPKFTLNNVLNPKWDVIKHRFGTTYLFADGATVQLYTDAGKGKTTEAAIKAQHVAWGKTKDPQKLYDLAGEALAAGMTPEAEAYCDELLALAKGKPTLPAEVKRFSEVYAAVGPKIKAAAGQPGTAADEWKERLNAQNVLTRGHYTLIYWDAGGDEVARRLAELEENFRAVYLWHALEGVALPVPERPLVAILPPSVKEAWVMFKAVDARRIAADGYFSAEHGVLVLAPERMDDVGQAFRQMVKNVYRGTVTRADLLKGVGPKIVGPPRPPAGTEPGAAPPSAPGTAPATPPQPELSASDVARMMTLAAIDRYQEHQGETAAISREATRQLLAAVGTLPRHVDLPRWVDSGVSSLFQRPRDPVFTKTDTDQPYMTVATTTGIGAANFAMLKYYRDLEASKDLNSKHDVLLRNVLAGAYFDGARLGDDIDRPANPVAATTLVPDPAAVKAKLALKLTQKAHATAWALTYYLAQTKLKELYLFYAELDKLPRDLPTDERAVLLAFGKAFGLLTADGTGLDDVAVKRFADAWTAYMSSVRSSSLDVAIEKPTPPTTNPPNLAPGATSGPPASGSP